MTNILWSVNTENSKSPQIVVTPNSPHLKKSIKKFAKNIGDKVNYVNFVSMLNETEQNFSELIRSIEGKAKSFHVKMNEALEQVEVLKKENERLTNELANEKMAVQSLNKQILDLNQELSSTKTNAVISSSSDRPTKEEINELIKEIDFCVEQIKK